MKGDDFNCVYVAENLKPDISDNQVLLSRDAAICKDVGLHDTCGIAILYGL